jgi:antitoxin CptB
MTAENDEDRLKRLRIRSWRRGIKEMDLILGGWSDAHLRALPAEDVALYDELLAENDHDLYQWVTGQATAPDRFSGLIRRIADEFAAL